MSQVSYNTPGTVASAPQKPHFADGLTGLLSTLVAHECRSIGF